MGNIYVALMRIHFCEQKFRCIIMITILIDNWW